MKIAVIGSREFGNARLVDRVMAEYRATITLLVSGGAEGADRLGADWANAEGVPTRIFLPPERTRHGFFHRNRQIADEAELVVAFWNGRSTGTKYTIDYARSLGRAVRIVRF